MVVIEEWHATAFLSTLGVIVQSVPRKAVASIYNMAGLISKYRAYFVLLKDRNSPTLGYKFTLISFKQFKSLNFYTEVDNLYYPQD